MVSEVQSDMSDTQAQGLGAQGQNDESVLVRDASATMAQRIEQKLREKIRIEHFNIVDTSGNCGSSYAVTIVSPDFAKKMTLARHKLVNQILADEITQLHAFSQKTFTPEQWVTERTKQ